MLRTPIARMLAAGLLAMASLAASAQSFPPATHAGWFHLRNDRPLLAAEAWLRVAQASAQRRLPAGLREAAHAHVLAAIAYERAGDARAYASWSDAIRRYLEAGASWEQDREALRLRWKTLERQLSQTESSVPPALSTDEQMLVDLVRQIGLLQYTGPRTGLAEVRDGSTDLSNVTPQYMAGAGRATEDEDIATPQPRYGSVRHEAARHTGPGRAGLQPEAAPATSATTEAAAAVQPVASAQTRWPPPPPPPAPVPVTVLPPIPPESAPASWLPRTATAVVSARAEAPPTHGSAIALQSAHLPRQFQTRPGTARGLSVQERETALLAWRYVQLNRQPTTGLVNGKDGYPVTTVADIAMTVSAYLSARALQFIDPQEFVVHLRQLLHTLGGLPLYQQELFNREYDSRTGRMLDLSARASTQGSGWSAEDIGRLLLWLKALAQATPDLAPAVDTVFARLRLQRLVASGQLHSVLHDGQRELVQRDLRLGRQHLTAAALSLWGIVLPQMFGYDEVWLARSAAGPVPADRREGGTLSADGFARGIIEFGGLDGCFEAAARAVLTAQHQLAQHRGHPVMVADELLDRAPWFVHGTLTDDGSTAGQWLVTGYDRRPRPELASFSTKAAYLWSAIDASPATRSARALADQLETSDHGLHGGRYLSGELNRALTLDTNASVLLSLYHTLRGGVPVLRVDNPVDHQCPALHPPPPTPRTPA